MFLPFRYGSYPKCLKQNPSKGILTEIAAFFASVKLALVLLITLAITSILGTVLPQGEPMAFYDQGYSPITGKLIRFFQLYDMYHSWWFQWVLLLLTINLLVCSLKRFSSTWKVVNAPSRSVSDHLFETLHFHRKFSFQDQPADSRGLGSIPVGPAFWKTCLSFGSPGIGFLPGEGSIQPIRGLSGPFKRPGHFYGGHHRFPLRL